MINELFKNLLKQNNKLAIICDNESITYTELNMLSNKYANFITETYNYTDQLIPFLSNRNIDTIAFIIATLKTGKTFIPINNVVPLKKLDLICKEHKISKIVSLIDRSTFNSNYFKVFNIDRSKIDKYSNEYTSTKIDKDSTAYTIFTSGSTGVPKGVMISFESLCNFAIDLSNELYIQTENFLANASLTFDASLLDIFYSIYNNMTIILSNNSHYKNPNKLLNLIEQFKIETIHLTPTMLNLLIDIDKKNYKLKSVKNVFVGGEELNISLVNKIHNSLNVNLYNFYGPTESTVYCSFKKIQKDTSQITIGNGFGSNKLIILLDDKDVVSCYSEKQRIGEICISGNQVFNGYLNDIEKTLNSKLKINNNIFYKTGDLGVYNENNEIIFKGRIGSQIKLNGNRIELEEIKNTLINYEYIENAIVFLNKFTNQINALYYSKNYIESDKIILYLKDYLPSHMIPMDIKHIYEISMNDNCKLDENIIMRRNYIDENKTKLINIIANTVDKSKSYIERNLNHQLFTLGIDSLLFVSLILNIEDEFNIEFEDIDLVIDNFKTIDCFLNKIINKYIL